MAKLRINGDSSGYVDLEAPNAASSSTLDLDQVPQKNAANTFSANTQVMESPSNAEALHIKGRSSDDIGQIKFMENDGTTTLGRLDGRTDKFEMASYSDLYLSANGPNNANLKINTSGHVTTPNQPSFYARIHASFSSTTTGAEIVPASSLSSQWNTGSGFSGNRFTAPVAGKYMFIFSAEKANNYSSVSVALSIFKNGSEFPNARLYDSNQNTRKTIQYTMIMDMAVNDYAEPFIYSYQTGSVYDNRGQFAGFLIG